MSSNSPFNKIWNNKNINDFIIAMDDWVGEKCDYGKKIELLSDAEKTFYYNQILEREVNNGGYSQFFFNDSGTYCYEILDSLCEIGATRTAEIHRKALEAFGDKNPKSCEERQSTLDDIDNVLSECDREFYQYQDDLNELNYQFVLKNKTQFTA